MFYTRVVSLLVFAQLCSVQSGIKFSGRFRMLAAFRKRSFLSMRPTASSAPKAQIFSANSSSLGMIGRWCVLKDVLFSRVKVPSG